MNKKKAKSTFVIDNVCRVCLNSTKHLLPMSNKHTKLYKSLVDEVVYNEYYMKNCVICQWMLQRFAKFKQQCWTANQLLKKATHVNSKLLLAQHNNLSIYNITQTSPVIENYNPTLDDTHLTDTHYSVHTYNIHNGTLYTSCKNTSQYSIFTEACNKSTFVNNESNDHNFSETHTDHGNDKYTNEHDKNANEHDKYTNEHDKYTSENDDTQDLIILTDEDELPLTLISDKKEGRNKKRKTKKMAVKDMRNPQDLQVETAKKPGDEEEDEENPKRIKKALRDGFSSRMVQETDEYIVIKLTREQVMKELSERRETESYVSAPYKCDKCVKGFNFQDVLETHMEKHSKKNTCSFVCDMCEQYCPSAVSLRGHIKSHTTRYQCKLCGAIRVSRQHLLEHHGQHSGAAPAYSCLQCTFTTEKRTVMQRHARGHATREPLACHQCGKLFKSIDYLRQHTARHDKSSRFKCSLCSDTFMYHSLLRKHVRGVHERNEFYCVECDQHFKCAESLKVHFKRAKRHRDPTILKFSCNACPARFVSAGLLATHLSSIHGAGKQHACQHCHRTYSTRGAVRAHTSRVHARGDARGDARVECQHCHTSFSRNSVLKAHLRAHGGSCNKHDKHEKEISEDKTEN